MEHFPFGGIPTKYAFLAAYARYLRLVKAGPDAANSPHSGYGRYRFSTRALPTELSSLIEKAISQSMCWEIAAQKPFAMAQPATTALSELAQAAGNRWKIEEGLEEARGEEKQRGARLW